VTYEQLFLEMPDKAIWCRLKKDDEEERDDSLYDGFKNFLDVMRVKVKEKIQGPSNQVPDSILIN
jgi:hypothetical protein